MDVVFEVVSGGRRCMGRDSEAKAGEDDNQQPQGKQPGPGRWAGAKKSFFRNKF